MKEERYGWTNMKYVKIWDNIYMIDKITEKYACIHDTDDLTIYQHDIRLDNNRAQFSDTIEELCNMYILIDKNKNKFFINLYGNQYGYTFDEDTTLYNIKETDTIYGAIWTSKGLIYVAKMNNNYRLELI